MLLPDLEGFVVVQIDCHPEVLFGQTHFLGQEFPSISYGFFLKIRPETKVPQHLEECVMPGGLADVVEVVVLAAGTDAFLAGGGAGSGRLLDPDKDVLKLVHSGVCEQKRRVVLRYDRRAFSGEVAFGNEIFPKALADIQGS